ncbi:MAG: sigma 54-interacting transcriptional regulator [Fusobacteriaceae bacterium]|nr:sigma 54-interacting transcriptional regulator [Fusobacteriaceae bacterium]
MINIFFIVPYPELKPIINEIYNNHPFKKSLNVNFLVMTVDMVRKYKMEKVYDVYVGRNFTFKELKKMYPNKAILEIPITGYDIVQAICEAHEKYHPKKIGIIGRFLKFFNVLDFNNLEEIGNCQLISYPIDEVHDMETSIRKAKKDKCDCIVGGYSTTLYVKDKGIDAVTIKVSKETIYKVFEEAIHIAQAIHEEREKSEILRIITKTSNTGIFYINSEKNIEEINDEAKKYFLNTDIDTYNRSIFQIAPFMKDAINTCFETGNIVSNKLYTFKNITISVDYTPVKVDNIISGIIICFFTVTKVQQLESQIRKKMSEKGLVAKYKFSDIIYKSSVFKNLIQNAKKYAAVSSNILIVGETGTGKELFVQSIHNESSRKDESFVGVNCAALSTNLLESELFGYEEGAFTGSKKGGQIGLFELAHKGTLFLDEISEIPISFQSKLLRVLQEHEVRRVGGTTFIPIDVRIITATNKNMKKLLAEGKFREDLLYRLDVLKLLIPPLRERKEDIIELFKYYLNYHCQKLGFIMPSFSKEAEFIISNYKFPGNIRELINITERLSVLKNNDVVSKEDMLTMLYQDDIDDNKAYDLTLPNDLFINCEKEDEKEKANIKNILMSVNHNKIKAAEKLGIDRTTLWRKMKKYGI